MPNYKFISSQIGDGLEYVQLIKENAGGLFRRASSETIPYSEWIRHAPTSGMSAIAALRTNDKGSNLEENDEGLIIPVKNAAQISEADGLALGLPPVSALTLQLRSGGSLAKGSINVETRWVRRGGQAVRADIVGVRIREGARTARLPEPLFSAYLAAQAVSDAATADDKRASFAELRLCLGEAMSERIDADGFIERIRIAYAANFSLNATTANGRFDFDPVLFSRHADETDDGDLVDASESSLLTVSENQHFQIKFRKQDAKSRSYLMPDGTLLFLDPLLGQALDVVRTKQKASSDQRRAFLSAPQKILREELNLDSRDDDEIADRLFIETLQFSERVNGIAIWQKPVLPWIKAKPNSWLPESFGIRIGEPPNAKHIELDYGEATQIALQVKQALSDNVEKIEWKGEEIPASSATLRAVDGIAALETEVAENDTSDIKKETAPSLETFFLQVGQNFEQVDYARLPRREESNITFTAPPMASGLLSIPQPHQKRAFEWLAEAWQKKIPGVLLADDMGLGKTFEALTFLAWLKRKSDKNLPILIIAPTGLLRNWQSEIRQHLENGLLGSIVEAFGNGLSNFRNSSGNDIRGGTSRLNVDSWENAGVILTTYETMRDYHLSFARIHFGAIIYDEIQKLKNPASQMARAAKALNADMQIAMTGTPVENRLQDLWSIADTVYPGFLGSSRDFERDYPASNPDKLAALQSHLIERDHNLPPFMLRRMKDEILTGLPEKTTQRYPVTMPPEQARAYDNVLGRARALRESGEKGAMLKVLHMLRGTSLHPHPPRGIDDIEVYISQSARLLQTFNILQKVYDNGEKALIFCEDLEMQSFLSMAVHEKFNLDRAPDCINGNVAGTKRHQIVAKFQSRPIGFDVMILSPKAGGVGLTITAANHVIHMSRWWNPAVEDQATDRVYRIGQQKPVTVHLPLAIHPDDAIKSSSFDKKLDDLMERKRALSKGLLLPPESDNDTEILLSDVLDGDKPAPIVIPVTPIVAPEKPQDSAISNIEPTLSTIEKTPQATRPILTVKISPIESAEARTPHIRRVEFKKGGTRDWTIFDQYIEQAKIKRLEIIDPYCCSDERSTGYLLNFINRFNDKAQHIGRFQIFTYDVASIKSFDYQTNAHQREDFEQRWQNFLPNTNFEFIQKSRRADQDFHDRSIKAHCENGDIIIWDVGRGVEGIMSAKQACVVNAYRECANAVASSTSF